MSYLCKHHRDAIAAYVARLRPFTSAPTSVWLSHLVELSNELADLKGQFWTLEPYTEEHYVYVYLDPRRPGRWEYILPSGRKVCFPYRPFYVGKGKGDRSLAHLSGAVTRSKHKKNKIAAIEAEGFKMREYIRYSSIYNVSDFMAQAYEIDLIAGIGRHDKGEGPLTNHTDGGDGVTGRTGWRHTNSTKRKQSLSHLGKTKSTTSRELMSRAKLGVAPSAKATEARLRAVKGVPKSPEHIARLKAARELLRTMDVVVEGVRYASAADASRHRPDLTLNQIKRRVNSDDYPEYRYERKLYANQP